MKRIYPRHIRDKFYLSRLLELYLKALAESPLAVTLRALSYDAAIPETIINRLQHLHCNPADSPNIDPEDYHILFANLMFRYPTVKLWETDQHQVFIEM
jgi:hypothetical protein